MARNARTFVLALLVGVLLSSHAFAQADSQGAADSESRAAARAGATVYELSQSQVPLGDVGVDVVRGDDGYHSNSFVSLDGLLDMADELVTDAAGAAVSYSVEGSVQGIAVSIEANFSDVGVELSIDQAGNTTSFTLNSEEPLYVLDNNFLDGWQVLAYYLQESGEESLEVAAVVPQAAALGRATISTSGASSLIVSDDEQVEASALRFTLTVRNQVIEGTLWVDDEGEIVVLEQTIGAVRFERRSGASILASGADDAGAAEEGSPAGDQGQSAQGSEATPAGEVHTPAAAGGQERSGRVAETAQELLARTSRCVEVTKLSVESTGATLQGLLSLPAEAADEPGVPTLVLLPGSGAVDLRGNSAPLINNAGYEQLANLLGCRGYGVLRVAKLGIAPSTGDGNAVTLDTYASNTADWLALLAQTPGVDSNRLGVIGHSEGGLVALYATANGTIDPQVLVLLSTPGRPFGVLIREQVLASARRGGADSEALHRLAGQIDEALAAIAASSGTRLEPEGDLANNPVISLFAHAAGLIRSELEQDPAELIAGLDLPMVIFQGGKDLQVLPVDGRTLAAAAPGALLLELPDMSHNLIRVKGPAVSGLLPHSDDTISTTLVEALVTYLHGTLRLAR